MIPNKQQLDKIEEVQNFFGSPLKLFIYRTSEIDDRFCNFLVDLHKDGYVLVKADI